MKQREIRFNEEMMAAVMDGSKTQTRRPVKPELVSHIEFMGGSDEETGEFEFVGIRYGEWESDDGTVWGPEWLTYCTEYPEEGVVPLGKLYGGIGDRLLATNDNHCATIEITGFRIERLQDISEQDTWAEGCEGYDDDVTGGKSGYGEFSDVWTSIYGDDSWSSNPWVWVIEFKVVSTSEVAA